MKTLAHFYTGLCLGLLLAPQGSSYAADAALSEEAFFADLPVVLTASRMDQPVSEIPAAITVIDANMIHASGAMNIADVLKLVPGFQTARVDGTESTVTYHGFSDQHARRMQVLVDGRSVYDPAFSGVVWHALEISLDDVEHIEVIRGPNAAAYGANAVTAIINIITKHSLDTQGTRLKTTFGDWNTRSYELSHSGSLDNGHYFRLTAGYDQDDGFRDRIDERHANRMTLRTDHLLDNGDQLNIQAGYRDVNFTNGFEGDILQPPRLKRHHHQYQQISWQRALSPERELKLQLYHNKFSVEDQLDVLFGAIPIHGGLDILSHRYDAEIEYSARLNSQWRLVTGAGMRRDTGEGGILRDGLIQRDQTRAFLNAEWRPLQDWVYNAGLMVENYEGIGTFYSPRIAANWHVNKYHTLRVGRSRAYRMPSLWEDYARLTMDSSTGVELDLIYLGNGDLQPERMDSQEFGYLLFLPQHNLSFDVRIFREEISHLIDAVIDETFTDLLGPTTEFVYTNYGRIRYKGFELQGKYQLSPRTFMQVGYSQVDAKGTRLKALWPTEQTEADLEENVPLHTWSALLAVELPAMSQASIAFYRTDEIDWRGEGDTVPPHQRYDLKLSKRFRLDSSDLETALTVRNITNQGYLDFRRENRAERQAFVTVQLEL